MASSAYHRYRSESLSPSTFTDSGSARTTRSFSTSTRRLGPRVGLVEPRNMAGHLHHERTRRDLRVFPGSLSGRAGGVEAATLCSTCEHPARCPGVDHRHDHYVRMVEFPCVGVMRDR